MVQGLKAKIDSVMVSQYWQLYVQLRNEIYSVLLILSANRKLCKTGKKNESIIFLFPQVNSSFPSFLLFLSVCLSRWGDMFPKHLEDNNQRAVMQDLKIWMSKGYFFCLVFISLWLQSLTLLVYVTALCVCARVCVCVCVCECECVWSFSKI